MVGPSRPKLAVLKEELDKDNAVYFFGSGRYADRPSIIVVLSGPLLGLWRYSKRNQPRWSQLTESTLTDIPPRILTVPEYAQRYERCQRVVHAGVTQVQQCCAEVAAVRPWLNNVSDSEANVLWHFMHAAQSDVEQLRALLLQAPPMVNQHFFFCRDQRALIPFSVLDSPMCQISMAWPGEWLFLRSWGLRIAYAELVFRRLNFDVMHELLPALAPELIPELWRRLTAYTGTSSTYDLWQDLIWLNKYPELAVFLARDESYGAVTERGPNYTIWTYLFYRTIKDRGYFQYCWRAARTMPGSRVVNALQLYAKKVAARKEPKMWLYLSLASCSYACEETRRIALRMAQLVKSTTVAQVEEAVELVDRSCDFVADDLYSMLLRANDVQCRHHGLNYSPRKVRLVWDMSAFSVEGLTFYVGNQLCSIARFEDYIRETFNYIRGMSQDAVNVLQDRPRPEKSSIGFTDYVVGVARVGVATLTHPYAIGEMSGFVLVVRDAEGYVGLYSWLNQEYSATSIRVSAEPIVYCNPVPELESSPSPRLPSAIVPLSPAEVAARLSPRVRRMHEGAHSFLHHLFGLMRKVVPAIAPLRVDCDQHFVFKPSDEHWQRARAIGAELPEYDCYDVL